MERREGGGFRASAPPRTLWRLEIDCQPPPPWDNLDSGLIFQTYEEAWAMFEDWATRERHDTFLTIDP